MYLNFFQLMKKYIISKSLFATQGSALISNILINYDTTDLNVQKTRLGLLNDASISYLIANIKKKFVNSYIINAFGSAKRRKRS